MANIVQIAESAGHFNTLIAALRATDILNTLQTQGPFTVFAPTDQAFAKLPGNTMEDLMHDIQRLKDILLYHVLSGEFLAEDILEMDDVLSMQGEKIVIDISQGVMVDNARVVQTDMEADNGVIHVIDQVLMPKSTARDI